MAVANSKNKVCDLLAFIHQKATLALIISMALVCLLYTSDAADE